MPVQDRNFISVNNYRLAYLDINAAAEKLIFFLHGNSSSADLWSLQLIDSCFNAYRLIAFDLPGHGLSDSSLKEVEDYSLPGTAAIIAAAIESLAGKQPYMIIGFSSGANITSELLASSIVPTGIVLIGSCVLGGFYDFAAVFRIQEVPSILTYNEKDETKVASFFNNHIHHANEVIIQKLQKDYTSVDPQFKPALFQSAADGKIADEIKLLKDYGLEVCVIFGADDSLINIDYLDKKPFSTWRNKVLKVPAAGHWVQIDKSEVVNNLILEYADEVFSAT